MWLAVQDEQYKSAGEEQRENKELLQDVSSVNDIASNCKDSRMQAKKTFCDNRKFDDVGASACIADDLFCIEGPLAITPEKDYVDDGICDFPPLSQVSFMIRGDNGVVRWVAAPGLDAGMTSRKRGRKSEVGDSKTTNWDDEEDEVEAVSVSRWLPARRTRSGLGYVNISALMQQLYEEAAAVSDGIGVEQPLSVPPLTQQKENDDRLWVVKYSPKRFRDLLSDDNINLKLLQWLKSWDSYIFQETPNICSSAATSDNQNNFADNITVGSSTFGRPEERLAVLVGPPGVGKTTLAHVLAAHCGYEVIEINASVDRTTSRLESAIQLAVAPARKRRRADLASLPPFSSRVDNATAEVTETKSLTSERGVFLVDMLLRPKCLIIDEMDGIAANVAAFLLQQDIHCPVFCLCNDYYVPSLRELRRRCQHVYHLPPIRPQRLLFRLTEIVEREGMSVSQPALASLVQLSNGDVRCCLNTLQFFYRNASQSEGRQGAVQLMREMQGKDAKLGIWDLWRAIFERQERSKYIQLLRKEYALDYDALLTVGSIDKPTKLMAAEKSNKIVDTQELQKRGCGGEDECLFSAFRVDPGYVYVSRMLQQCSEMAVLLDGLQEHYLQRLYFDYSFCRTCEMSKAFSFQDCLATLSYRDASCASLIPFVDLYACTTAASCFSHCSSLRRCGFSISFPREFSESSRRLAEAVHIARTFREGCHGEKAAHFCSAEIISQDVAPLLLRCLLDVSLRCPAYSVVSVSAFGQREQQLLLESIARHAEYGLTYARSLSASRAMTSAFFLSSAAGDDGQGDGAPQEHWELTPPIHRLGCVSVDSTRAGAAQQASFATPSGTTAGRSSFSMTSAASIMVLRMKEEMKQLMTGEIRRVVIQNSFLRSAKRNAEISNSERSKIAVGRNTGQKNDVVEEDVAPEVRKRAREVKQEDGGETKDKKKVLGMSEGAELSQSAATSTVKGPDLVANAGFRPNRKRDFFGRIIQESAEKPSSLSATTETGATRTTAGGSKKLAATRLTVQYTYHDGSTNAVKIPAVFADF